MNDNREYRVMSFNIEKRDKDETPSYLVEGYASTFDPYVLFSDGGVDYSEQIDTKAFDNSDMSDCVFRVDHEGPVYARVSAGTVQLDVDDHGLHCVVDLSKTQRSRDLYEDIAAGNYPQMSFAFTVSKDSYNRDTTTRTILAIDKVFDISPVSFPANPGTELDISTRDYFNGVIEAEKTERSERERIERAKKSLELRLRLL